MADTGSSGIPSTHEPTHGPRTGSLVGIYAPQATVDLTNSSFTGNGAQTSDLQVDADAASITLTDTSFARHEAGAVRPGDASLVVEGVNFGEGADANTPFDVQGCEEDFGADAFFIYDAGAGCTW